jgi:hypothetical protein
MYDFLDLSILPGVLQLLPCFYVNRVYHLLLPPLLLCSIACNPGSVSRSWPGPHIKTGRNHYN